MVHCLSSGGILGWASRFAQVAKDMAALLEQPFSKQKKAPRILVEWWFLVVFDVYFHRKMWNQREINGKFDGFLWYSLVNKQFANWKMAISSEFVHRKWWFYKAMVNYQTVFDVYFHSNVKSMWNQWAFVVLMWYFHTNTKNVHFFRAKKKRPSFVKNGWNMVEHHPVKWAVAAIELTLSIEGLPFYLLMLIILVYWLPYPL